MAADVQRLTELQKQLADATPLLGGRRRRRAAEQLAELARQASPEAIRALAQAVASSADESVREIAWNALKDLRSPAAIQALCALWASSRLQELGVLIAECGYVAAAPIELRVLTALAADRLELVTGDSTAVKPLTAACSDPDPLIAERARTALRHLNDPAAIQALCALWASNRLPELGVLIAECAYVPAAPIELRVLSALAADRLELVTGDSTAVKPLIAASSDPDPLIAKRARTALRHLQDPAAIEELCAELLAVDDEVLCEIAIQAGYVPSDSALRAALLALAARWQELDAFDLDGLHLRAAYETAGPEVRRRLAAAAREAGRVPAAPIELRVLSALAADRLELVSGDSTAVKPLIAARSDRDPLIAERARTALRHLQDPAAIEELCAELLAVDDEVLCEIAIQAGYVPSDSALRAALLALAARWQELDAFDLDGLHLRAAYETAGPEVRRRLAAAAREAGRAEWVQVAVGGRQRLRLAQMTRSEWQDVLALLADPARATEAWRLAQEAPPLWGRALLLGIGDAAALPECDREDFARLRALAESCGVGEESFSDCVSCFATLQGHEDRVTSLAVTPDGRLLASASYDTTIRLWSLPDGGSVRTLGGSLAGWVFALAITPDGSLLASDGFDNIHLFRLPDGKCLSRFTGHGAVHALAVTPDGSLLASGGINGPICLWRLPDGKLVKTLTGHEGLGATLAVSPDGSALVGAGSRDGTIGLWSLPDGECVATLRGHESWVFSLAITPDGSLLASGSLDSTIRLWRLPGGKCVATLRGHESLGLVSSLAVTPGGRLLASGSYDNTIRLWRLPDGECVATLRGHENRVTSLAVTPDGSLIASGSEDATIRLWRLPLPLAAPVAVLAPGVDRLLELRGDDRTGRGRAWLDFMLALVDRHRRFDIEVVVVDHVEVGEFDIEIGD